ncbi:MAG: HAD-IA family hydrolase [Oligoflexia bacterium]|nr:HAD-IA family hydrolase [Oligoflexia bacterium]
MEKSTQYQAVVFDFDGTLVDSRQFILESLVTLVKRMKNVEMSKEEMDAIYEPSVEVMISRLGLPWETEADRMEVQKQWALLARAEGQKIQPFMGATRLLTSLLEVGYDVYLWTARDRASTLQVMETHGMTRFFKDIRCADDTPQSKPNPSGMEELVPGLDKSKVCLIGDSEADKKGAHNFGCDFIGACWDERAQLEIDDLVKHSFTSLNDIEDFFITE